MQSIEKDDMDQHPPKRCKLGRAGGVNTFATSRPSTRHRAISVGENSTCHNGNEYLHSSDHDLDCGKLLESLSFDRRDARLRNVTSATPKTCEWLFHHKDFKAWLQDDRIAEHHGFLWIKGKPGSGKSTIMKTAWQWANKRRTKNGIVLSLFFNARAPNELEKSCMGLYR